MRFMTKENISEVQRNVHQWMTIIGFPILIVLVGDMYYDFKQVRANDIRQDERLTRHKEEIQELKSSVETMGNYVWRGVR